MKLVFESVVKYTKETEEGLLKKVSERYLVSAVNHTDAEETLTRIFSESIRGDFDITKLTILTVSDVVDLDGPDDWYKLKYIYMDIESGKKVPNIAFVNASDCVEANNKLLKKLSDFHLAGLSVEKIELTPIIEAFLDKDQWSDESSEF